MAIDDPDTLFPLRWVGVQVSRHAIQICGPQTGHAVRDVVYCDSATRAEDIVKAIRAMLKQRAEATP